MPHFLKLSGHSNYEVKKTRKTYSRSVYLCKNFPRRLWNPEKKQDSTAHFRNFTDFLDALLQIRSTNQFNHVNSCSARFVLSHWELFRALNRKLQITSYINRRTYAIHILIWDFQNALTWIDMHKNTLPDTCRGYSQLHWPKFASFFPLPPPRPQ